MVIAMKPMAAMMAIYASAGLVINEYSEKFIYYHFMFISKKAVCCYIYAVDGGKKVFSLPNTRTPTDWYEIRLLSHFLVGHGINVFRWTFVWAAVSQLLTKPTGGQRTRNSIGIKWFKSNSHVHLYSIFTLVGSFFILSFLRLHFIHTFRSCLARQQLEFNAVECRSGDAATGREVRRKKTGLSSVFIQVTLRRKIWFLLFCVHSDLSTQYSRMKTLYFFKKLWRKEELFVLNSTDSRWGTPQRCFAF